MANAKIEGMYRIMHVDANDIPLSVVMEKHSSEFLGVTGTPEADAQKMPKFKKPSSPILNEDEKLVLAFKPDEATTQASSAAAIVRFYRVPVTFHNMRSGNAFEKTLTANDFNNIEEAAVDKVWPANQWVYLDEYILPAQSQMVLGHSIQDVRVDSAIRLQIDVNTA